MALSSTFLNPLVTFNRHPKITSARKGFRVKCATQTEQADVETSNNGSLSTKGFPALTPITAATENALIEEELGNDGIEEDREISPHISTKLVNYHADWDTLKATSTPIYQTATFKMKSAREFGPYGYTRTSNPTRDALEKLLSELDHAEYAYCFSTGMSALTAVCELVDNDDEIITVEDIYGGSYTFINNLLARKKGIKVKHVDTSNPENVANAMTDKTKMVWLENPNNPQLKISDIKAIADIAHSKDAIVFIDNSVMSPVLSQPLDHGADIVMHSATKFIGGNSSCMGGSLATNDKQLAEKLKSYRNATGCSLSPFDSWVCLEGIKTMDLRVQKKQENAKEIAKFLVDLKKKNWVQTVNYPGLVDHPGYDVHKKQSNEGAIGSVISFTTGNLKLSEHIVEKSKFFSMTVSFGGVGSAICLPWYTSHGSVPDQKKQRMGLKRDLVRISVGIEKVDDLKQDLNNAFSSFGKRCCC